MKSSANSSGMASAVLTRKRRLETWSRPAGLGDVAVLAVDYEGLHGRVLSSYGGVGGGEGEVDVPLARHIFSDLLFP